MPSDVHDHLFRSLYHLEGERLFAETQVLGGDEAVQENVDTWTPLERGGREWEKTLTFSDRVRHRHNTVH